MATPALELPVRAARATESADVSVEVRAANPVHYPAEHDDLIEEPMDYTPIAPGRVAAPEHPPEEWPDGSGPTGF